MFEQVSDKVMFILARIGAWVSEPSFFVQVAIIIAALILAYVVERVGVKLVPFLREEPTAGRFFAVRKALFSARDLLRPLLIVIFLAIGASVADVTIYFSWLIRAAQSLSVAYLLYSVIKRYIANPMLSTMMIWIGVPAAILWAFGWLDEAQVFLDSMAISIGNIRVSALLVFKAIIAGGFFFWLGRRSNDYGQTIIHKQETIDPPTRELFSKLFEILLFAIITFMLLQVLGLDLTALAIFGGALGVGLGFGLQQIASNFISGIILLLERSMGAGDYIELEDGRGGILSKINMRSSVLKTFDGKEIMVPNEKFITTRFVNWTRDDPSQRYEVGFYVPYDADLSVIPDIVNEAVNKDPRILSDPEPARTELRAFGEYRIAFGVTFWVQGLDDGLHRFSSDIMFLIWQALRDAEIPMTAKFGGPRRGGDDKDGGNDGDGGLMPDREKI